VKDNCLMKCVNVVMGISKSFYRDLRQLDNSLVSPLSDMRNLEEV
jgi:hypothetical protein